MKSTLLQIERERRGWSQSKVADAVGTTSRTVRRWEQGNSLPTPYYREKLCLLFGMDAVELGFVKETSVEEKITASLQHEQTLFSDPVPPEVDNAFSLSSHEKERVPAQEDGPASLKKHYRPNLTRRQLLVAASIGGGMLAFTGGVLFTNIIRWSFSPRTKGSASLTIRSLAVISTPFLPATFPYTLFYLGANNHVYELAYLNNIWRSNDVNLAAKNAPIAAASSALAVICLQITRSVLLYYLGSNRHVYQLTYRDGMWGAIDISSIAVGKASLADLQSAIVAFPFEDNAPRVYYLDLNNHVYELAWVPWALVWYYRDLTVTAGNAPTAAPHSALAAFALDDETLRVYYLGSNNYVYELSYRYGMWGVIDVSTAAGNAPLADLQSAILAFTLDGAAPRVYYLSLNNHVCELSWSMAEGWNCTDVTVMVGNGYAAAADSPLAGFHLHDKTIRIYYIGPNRHVYELVGANDTWHCVDITISTLYAPDAILDSGLAAFTPDGISSLVYYVGSNEHVYELVKSGTKGWSSFDWNEPK